jgi:small subunit ribosomal protein S9
MEEEKKDIKQQAKNCIYATGKRKSAVARIRLYPALKEEVTWENHTLKLGDILVNAKPIAEYFPSEVQRHMYTQPTRLTNTQQQNYSMTIRITGGGPASQLDAVVCAIANALSKLDPGAYRAVLKQKGLLTRDSRIRQRRNVGMGGKSRRKKQSPKR